MDSMEGQTACQGKKDLARIPHWLLRRRIKAGLRTDFKGKSVWVEGKSLRGRIFGVGFWSDSAKMSSRKKS
jgi:hypothetical protein